MTQTLVSTPDPDEPEQPKVIRITVPLQTTARAEWATIPFTGTSATTWTATAWTTGKAAYTVR